MSKEVIKSGQFGLIFFAFYAYSRIRALRIITFKRELQRDKAVGVPREAEVGRSHCAAQPKLDPQMQIVIKVWL